ncbi:MAG: ABC transporter permease [Bacteroidetes bacterium]|nr:ABC transporter permease [Bacteroidota bacterium]MDA1121559.1 ABC transporter permease [Bacteroidota bacterium]
MNLPYFISSRIRNEELGSFSSIISKIAIASIAIGLAAMIISFLILRGFEKTVTQKIYDFSGHLQITKYTLSEAIENQPISLNSEFYANYQDYDFIDHVQEYAHKPGLLKTDEEVQGVIFKGVAKNFDLSHFQPSIEEGRFINFPDSTYSNEIILSRRLCNKLKLSNGDNVIAYFVQDPPRFRRFDVVGIYDTGLEEFDEKVVLADIDMIRRLNNWPDSLAGGLEVFVKDTDLIDEAEMELFSTIDFDLYVDKVSDKYIQIFDWLGLIGQNVIVFLILVLFIACFNMVSILLILIMERTQMIGMFKALGASDALVRRIFSLNGMYLVIRGMVIGNVIGLGFGVLQYYFKIIPLDPENYYMSFVPIHWDFQILILLNVLTFFLVNLTLLVPTIIVSRITPIKAIRFN